MLSNRDIEELTAFRRELHQWPELSGEERQTAERVAAALEALGPGEVVTGLGGHGVAAVFDSGRPGETVMFRAELDALPIEERHDIPWVSQVPGKAHVCGHDGHMTMLLALGRMLARRPVARGRVVLMFQPAEETGAGARAVVGDPGFARVAPDWAFAIHLLPGVPYGRVAVRPGLINCASLGLRICLSGRTAHAADPGSGLSPAGAVARLVPRLGALGPGGALEEGFRLVTVTHLNVGEPTFGIAPGEGVIHATLRAASDAILERIEAEARALARAVAEEEGLRVAFDVVEPFAASVNHPDAYHVAARALEALGVPHGEAGVPMRASEDFGIFGHAAKAAMLCLGPGEDHAALHNPDYDFPDDLIPVGAGIFERIARDLLG